MTISQEELFEREKQRWFEYLNEAKIITGEDVRVDLTFHKDLKKPIGIFVPMGRMSAGLIKPSINITPEICGIKTSSNFKLLSLSHELGSYHLTCSLRYPIYAIFLRPWPKYEERYCNRFVFDKLTEQYDKEEATKRMYQFVEEWIRVQDILYGSSFQQNLMENCNNYIKKYMPFLLERDSI